MKVGYAMKSKPLERIYCWLLLIILGGIVLHAPMTVWLGSTVPDLEWVFKAWKELLMAVCGGIAVLLISKNKLWAELSNDVLFRLILLFGLLHLILLLPFWQGTAASFAGLAIDLRYIFFFCLVYVCIRITPEYKKLFMWVGLAGAFIVGLFALLQTTILPKDILTHIGYSEQTIQPYLTVDKDPDFVRINSTLRGPNPLGAYMAILLGLVAAYSLKYWKKLKLNARTALLLLAVCGLAGLWASYSRSAIVAVVIGLTIVGIVAGTKVFSRRNIALIAVSLVFIVGLVFITKGPDIVSQVILHENPDGGSKVSSNDEHAASLAVGLARMAQQPFGAGVGSTGSASLYGDSSIIIENQYLFIAHEIGWLGLGLFIFIFGFLLSRLWEKRNDWLAIGLFASGIGLGLIGLVQPVWVDDTVSIIWWGLAAVALVGKNNVKF